MKRAHTLYLLCFFLLVHLAAVAQDVAKMSMHQLFRFSNQQLLYTLEQQTNDTLKVKLLTTIAIRAESKPGSLKGDIDTATIYLAKADSICQRIHWTREQAEIAMMYGEMYYHTDEPEKRDDWFKKALGYSRILNNKTLEADIWTDMGKSNDSFQLREACLDTAIRLYSGEHRPLEAANARKELADVHLNMGRYEAAEYELKQVLEVYQAHHYPQIYYTYDLLSAVNHWRGNFAESQANAYAAIQAAELAKDSGILGNFYWRLAAAYQDNKDTAQREVYLKKALIAQLRHPSSLLYHILGELTDLLTAKQQVDEALHYLLMVKQQQPPSDIHDKISLSFSMADCYLAQHDDARAAFYYLQYANQLGDGDDVNNYLMKICRFYLDRHQYKKAVPYLDRVLAEDPRYRDLPTSREISRLQFRVDSARGDLAGAMQHLLLYNQLSDSAFAIEKIKQAAEMQAKFDLDNQEKDNQLLREKSALQTKTIEKDNLLKKAILVGCAILLLLLLLLYNRYRIKIRSNTILRKQQDQISSAYATLEELMREKNKLLGEKEFLLKEIHHRVKNDLQLTMSLLSSQRRFLDNEAAIQAINDSEHRLKSLSLVHQKLYQGDDARLVNIKTYIQEILDYLKDSFGAWQRVHFELHLADVMLDTSKAVPLGLILNEAVTNIFKYAFPGRQHGNVEISLTRQGRQLHFRIKDNGIGLPPGFNIAASKSLGFSLITGLSLQLEADLAIEGKQGVEIRLVFEMAEVYA